MKFKCLVLFSILVSTEAARIIRREIIPVNVVYLEHSKNFGIPRERSHVRFLQNRNLDEKVQLSEEELRAANEHVPIAYKSATTDEQNEDVLDKTKNAFLGGLSNLRKRIDSLPFRKNENKPSSEEWSKLNENIESIFRKYKKSGVKEENQNTNFFTEMLQSASNWFQGVSSNQTTGQEDEQSQGPDIGQIWSDFQQSVNTFFNNVSNNNQASSTTNTVLGDTQVASSTQGPGVFSFFNNIFNFNNQGGQPGVSGDNSPTTQNVLLEAYNNFINSFNTTPNNPDNPPSSTQGPVQSFSDSVDEFFGQSSKPPSASGDSGTENKPQSSFIDNLGSAIQNIFNPSTTPSSGILSEGSTSSSNIPIISSIQEGLQQVGSGLQYPGGQQNASSLPSGNLPGIQQIQNFGQQIAGNIQNNNALGVQQLQVPSNLNIDQIQSSGQQLGGNSQVPGDLSIDQIQSAGQQLAENLQIPSNLNIDQIQSAGQQLGGNSQVPNNLNIDQIQATGQQLAGNSQVPSNLNIDQIQAAGQQLAGNSQVPNNLNIDQIQSAGQQLAGNLQIPSNLNIDQIQSAGQQLVGNSQVPNNLNIDQIQAAGQQLAGNSQVPSNLNIDQIQAAGQQLAGNLQVPSNLNIDQIPTSVQQPGGNSTLPSYLGIDQIQSASQQFLGSQSQKGLSPNILNQLQSTSSQVQNAIGSVNNSLSNMNVVDSQIQQVFGSNQLTQLPQHRGGGSVSPDEKSTT